MSISDERLAEIVTRYLDAAEPFSEEIGMIARELQSLRAAAKVRAIREGDGEWVMVPREPTEAMLMTQGKSRPDLAKTERTREIAEKLNAAVRRMAAETYREMIAASPIPATGGEKE